MTGRVTATRYHDISCGHRVVGHEGKCRHLHGHNYRVHFTVAAIDDTVRPGADAPGVDHLGRVLDFSAIKSRLCMWLEDFWDHKMLLWREDPLAYHVQQCDPHIVEVPFNPTAEAMAKYLVDVIGPQQLAGTGVELIEVTIDETRKCSATYKKEKGNAVPYADER